MSRLTSARNSIWSAIDHWPSLNPDGRSVFRRKFRHNDDEGLLMFAQDAALGDLPAIDIIPSGLDPNWLTQRTMEFPLVLDIKLLALRLEQAEILVEQVWTAIYQAAPEDSPTVTYVRAATGYYPCRLGPLTPLIVTPGNGKARAWQFTLKIGLKFLSDPLGAA